MSKRGTSKDCDDNLEEKKNTDLISETSHLRHRAESNQTIACPKPETKLTKL